MGKQLEMMLYCKQSRKAIKNKTTFNLRDIGEKNQL